MTENQHDTRADYIAGLRALADILEQHDDLPLPSTGSTAALDWWFFPHVVEDPRETMAKAVRLLPGTKTKTVGEGGSSSWFTVTAHLHGLWLDLNARRNTVCTRVVTGTREVVEEVPDPDALAAVPTTTVTRTEDVVEWDCGPILADREQVTA